jgi:hypothetical protein
MRVDEIRTKYNGLGFRVFKRSLRRKGLFRAKYDEVQLIQELQKVYPRSGMRSSRPVCSSSSNGSNTASPWPVSLARQASGGRAPDRESDGDGRAGEH